MIKYKEIMSYVIIIVVVILIRSFIATPVRVDGSSMNPTLHNNDILLLKKFDKSIDRFDIVVIKYEKSKLVKRVIGLPGERVKISITKVGNNYVSKILINGEVLSENYGNAQMIESGIASSEIVLGEDEYFVLGDNRNNSADSRIIGVINKKNITGVTDFRFFPFNKIGKFN